MTPEQEKELLEATKLHIRLQKGILAVLIILCACVAPFAAIFSWSLVSNMLGFGHGLMG